MLRWSPVLLVLAFGAVECRGWQLAKNNKNIEGVDHDDEDEETDEALYTDPDAKDTDEDEPAEDLSLMVSSERSGSEETAPTAKELKEKTQTCMKAQKTRQEDQCGRAPLFKWKNQKDIWVCFRTKKYDAAGNVSKVKEGSCAECAKCIKKRHGAQKQFVQCYCKAKCNFCCHDPKCVAATYPEVWLSREFHGIPKSKPKAKGGPAGPKSKGTIKVSPKGGALLLQDVQEDANEELSS